MESLADSNWGTSEILRQWPLKFRNVSIIYAPRNSRLLDGVQWNDIYGGFHRRLAPAAALLLTDRHIIVIAEEKTFRLVPVPGVSSIGVLPTVV